MYKLKGLEHTELRASDSKGLIFKLSEDILKDSEWVVGDAVKMLEHYLDPREEYYVAHNYLLHKGKVKKLLGHAVIAKKVDIVAFVGWIVAENDCRELRILAVNNPAFVAILTDEGGLYVYNKIIR